MATGLRKWTVCAARWRDGRFGRRFRRLRIAQIVPEGQGDRSEAHLRDC